LLELFFHLRNDHGKLCLGKNTLLKRTGVNLLYCIAKSFGILRKKDDLQHTSKTLIINLNTLFIKGAVMHLSS